MYVVRHPLKTIILKLLIISIMMLFSNVSFAATTHHQQTSKVTHTTHHHKNKKMAHKKPVTRRHHKKVVKSPHKPAHPVIPTTASDMQPANITQSSTPLYRLSNVEKRLVEFIRNSIASVRYTKYQYGSGHIDPSKGVYIVDCSRYVDFIMQKLYPNAYATLVESVQSEKPTTNDYFQYLSNLGNDSVKYWDYLEKVESLRPGDVLVFRYTNRRGNETGGHIMIVMDAPLRHGDTFFIRVADSAAGAHSRDTRSQHNSGIGIGTLLLKVDPKTSQPVAYAWRVNSRWEHNVNIAMGRPATQYLG